MPGKAPKPQEQKNRRNEQQEIQVIYRKVDRNAQPLKGRILQENGPYQQETQHQQ